MNSSSIHARRSIWRTSIVAACFASALTACSNTTDPVTQPAISELTGPTAAVNVQQGFFAKSVIAIQRSSAFDGVVELSADGVPLGMLVSFSPPSLRSTETVSEMTITALTTLSPGAHAFTVRASGAGVDSKTLTVSVIVTVPAITVTASTAVTSVAQGSTQVIPVTITREGGFTGIVGLAVLGLPTGVTATFSPQAIESGATTSTLTLSAPLSAQTGVTTVTLRASAQGLADKTMPIAVTVVPATSAAILMSANPVFLQVDGGNSIESVLTLQRFAGFNGTVNVSVDGLPPNLTATMVPFTTGSNTTTLRISVSDEELGGTYQLTLRANGTGIQQASTGLAVQTRLMPQFGLTFAGLIATNLPVTINRGANATMRLNIHRYSDYSVPVSLSAASVPTGVTTNLPTSIPASGTAAIPPSNFTTQPFDVALSVSADATPGVYTVAVRGQASTFTREVSIVLTVK